MLAIQIGYDNGKSEEMVFPLDDAGKSKIDALREEAERENKELTIRSSRSSVQKLPSCINGMEFDRQSQKELEFLNERFGHLTREEQDTLSAVLEMEEPETLKEIINLSYNLSNYELLREVSDSGRIAAELLSRDKKIEVPEELWPMLDFERIRERYFDTHQGSYCPSGLVLKCEEKEFTQVYDGFCRIQAMRKTACSWCICIGCLVTSRCITPYPCRQRKKNKAWPSRLWESGIFPSAG